MVIRLSKKFRALPFVLLVFSMLLLLLLVEPCVAPISVPMFPSAAPEIVSVKINSNHQYFPPSYSSNPYTGETTQTSPARYRPNGTIEITIKNRPFTPYTDKDGNQINIYYTIFAKITSGWDENYVPDWTPELESIFGPSYIGYQSDTDYTVVTFTYFPDTAPDPHLCVMYEGELVHFRVQAVTGYFIHNGEFWDRDAVYEGEGSEPTIFHVIIPVSTNYKPTPTSTTAIPSSGLPSSSDPSDNLLTQPDYPWLYLFVIVGLVCVIVVLLVVVVYQFRERASKNLSDGSVKGVVCEVRCYG